MTYTDRLSSRLVDADSKVLLDDLHLYAPEAQRAMKLLALTVTKAGDNYLSKHAPEIHERFPRQTHWSIASLPVFFFYPLCAARGALEDLGATDAVLQIMQKYYPKGLEFIAFLDGESANYPGLFSDSKLTELIQGLDFWPGDSQDYAKIRLRDRDSQRHWAEAELTEGSVTTLDMLYWVFHTAAPWEMVDKNQFTPFYWESEELTPDLYMKFREYHRSNRSPQSRNSYLLEIRRGANAYRVSILSPYGTFTQYESNGQVRANPSQRFLPCRPPVFLASEVSEFEQLINDPPSERERHLQEFLGAHSQFLRAVGSQGFRPQVHLIRQDIDGSPEKRANLYPDFLIEQIGLSPHAIVELKRAQAQMTAGPADRRNFASQLSSALRQLDDYWSFFQDSSNRRWFEETYGQEISNPELILLMGNEETAEAPLRGIVHTPIENRPVRLLTYFDILAMVRCQHLIIPG